MGESITIEVRVVPRARRPGLEVRDGRLVVRVAAAPVDGAANTAVQASVARAFGVRARQVVVVAGRTARDKRIEIVGASADHRAAWTARGLKKT